MAKSIKQDLIQEYDLLITDDCSVYGVRGHSDIGVDEKGYDYFVTIEELRQKGDRVILIIKKNQLKSLIAYLTGILEDK